MSLGPQLECRTGTYSFKVHGLDTRFYGRRAELEMLFGALKRAVNERELQVVAISGKSGLGKSRLIHEFVQMIDSESRGMTVIKCDSLSNETDQSQRCSEQIVRARFNLASNVSTEECRAAISAGLKSIVDTRKLGDAANLLTFLLGLPVENYTIPESSSASLHFQARALNTLYNLLKFDASRQPQIFVFDEFQWARHLTRELVTGLAKALANTATLIVVASKRAIKSELFGEQRVESLKISQLPDPEMTKVLRYLLRKVHQLPDSFVEGTVARAKGVPGLLEDIVRLMLQREIIVEDGDSWSFQRDKLQVKKLPDSQAGAAKARMDELSEFERQILGMASVLGTTFWFGGVLSLIRAERIEQEKPQAYWVNDKTEKRLNATLLSLQGHDIIDFTPSSGLPDEVAFVFINSIEQQKIYAELPAEKRRFYHRMAGQWLKESTTEKSFQLQELIAWHYERGNHEYFAAAAYAEAGRIAADSFQNRRATELYGRAVDLFDLSCARERCNAYHALARLHILLGEYGVAHSACGEMLYNSVVVNCKVLGGKAYHLMGAVASARAEYSSAMEHLEHGHKLFQDVGSLEGISDSLDGIGKVHWLRGDYGSHREALSCFLKALSLHRKMDDRARMATSLTNIGRIHLARGQAKQAAESHQEALLIRRSLKDRLGIAISLHATGTVHYECNRYELAEGCWSEALAVASEVGNRELYAELQTNLGWAKLAIEQINAAEIHLNQAYETAHDIGDKRALGDCLCAKATLAMKRGLHERSWNLAMEAYDAAEAIHAKQLMGQAQRVAGEVLGAAMNQQSGSNIVKDSDKQASECFQRSMRFYEEMGHNIGLAKSMASYGNFLLERGITNKGRKLLGNAEQLLKHLF